MAKHMFRLSVPAFLLGLILYPAGGLQALGLGEARVESWLGQPLDVTVGLLDVDRDEAESVRVVPASLADFERLGIPSEALGLGLEVEVDRRATPPQVRVRSRHSANDPIVRLLLDARWSSGRVLREYTLFLDPPTTPSAPPVVETGAKSSRPDAAGPVADPVPSREAASRPARAQETEAASSGMSRAPSTRTLCIPRPAACSEGGVRPLPRPARLETAALRDVASIRRATPRRPVTEDQSCSQTSGFGGVSVVSSAGLLSPP